MIRKLWTDELPKQSGFYWFKDMDGDVSIARVKRSRVTFLGEDAYPLEYKLSAVAGKWHGPIPFPSLHRTNKHEAKLKELTLTVIDCLIALEAVMTKAESAERGSKVAKISNALEFANDAAMHFGLDMSFESMSALKRKRERLMRRSKDVRR